jgi:hypothetical protein
MTFPPKGYEKPRAIALAAQRMIGNARRPMAPTLLLKDKEGSALLGQLK